MQGVPVRCNDIESLTQLSSFPDNKLFDRIDRRQRGKDYATYARALLDLTDVSIHTFQACIHLGAVCFSDSNTKSEAQYFSVAVLLAFILDLPNRSCESELERQANLRGISSPSRIWDHTVLMPWR